MTEIILKTLAQMYFVPKVLLFMLLGLVAAELMIRYAKPMALWIGRKRSNLSRYLFLNRIFRIIDYLKKQIIRFMTGAINLPKELISLIPISFTSTVAANAALVSLYKEKTIQLSQKELILAAILNSVPTYFRQVLIYHIPVLIPILGWKIGGAYLVCYMLAAVSKVLFCSAVTNFSSAKKEKLNDILLNVESKERSDRKKESFFYGKLKALFHFVKIPDSVADLLIRPLAFFARIAINLVVITFFVLFLINSGCLDGLFKVIAPFLKIIHLPAELSAPLATFISGHIVAGAGIMAVLIQSGIITNFQALAALVFGALIGLPVFTLRQVLPNYAGVFGWRLGGKIVAIAFTIALLTRIATFLFLITLI